MANESFTSPFNPVSDPIGAGFVVKTPSFTTHIKMPSGLGQYGYKAGKGKLFVLALLGVEDKDGKNPVDVEKAMNSIGWFEFRINWVECVQFWLGYRNWAGNARDLRRMVENLKDYGMTAEEVEAVGKEINWVADTQQMAWEKVFLKIKKMYGASIGRDPNVDSIHEDLLPKDPSPPKKMKTKKKGR